MKEFAWLIVAQSRPGQGFHNRFGRRQSQDTHGQFGLVRFRASTRPLAGIGSNQALQGWMLRGQGRRQLAWHGET